MEEQHRESLNYLGDKMAYKKSFYRQFKDVIKAMLINIGKRSDRFRRFYEKNLDAKRHKRYLKYANLPIDKKTIIFESFMARRYADSPRAIYEYMLKNPAYRDYKFIWSFRAQDMGNYMWLNDNVRTRVIQFGNEEYYKLCATAGYWITNSRMVDSIDLRPEQTYVQCWHGTPLKRLGFDIEVKGDNSQFSKEILCEHYRIDALKYTYMLSPSRFCTKRFISAFGLRDVGREDIIIQEGYPRNDFLKNYTEKDVSRVKRELKLPRDKKVILYAPTWRDNKHDAMVGGYVFENPVDFDKLRNAIGDEYIILFRPHYFIANKFDFSRYEGFVYNVANYPEINDLYIVSDMLITDYSSVFFDYSILKRPIIFYMYDLKYYQNVVRGFYISLEDLPGPILQKESELIDSIKGVTRWTNTAAYEKKYKEFSDRFTYLDDGKATERVVKRIFGGKTSED